MSSRQPKNIFLFPLYNIVYRQRLLGFLHMHGPGRSECFYVFFCECQQYQKDQIDECRRHRMIRVKRMERRFLESFEDESLRAQRKGAFVILVVAVVTAGVDPGLLDRQTEGERIVVVPFCVRKGMGRQRLNRCA